MRTQITQLLERNEALQASVETIQQQQNQEKASSHHGKLDEPEPQPVSAEIWNAPVLEGFKSPSLSSYDGKSDPVEHVTSFNTRMVVLMAMLMAGTLFDVALCWYMNQPRFSIINYPNMTKKLIHQLSASRHRKISTTSLFNVRQEQNESLRSYLARYNDTTIKVVNPNQELLAGAFQNGLMVGPFNESLAQKPADSMEEIISRVECYNKGEESNAEKNTRDAKERHGSTTDKRNYYPPPNRDQCTFKRQERRIYNVDEFTLLNTRS